MYIKKYIYWNVKYYFVYFFRYLQSKANEEKSNYLQSALLSPVRAVREEVQIAWAHTESVKNTIQDNYSEVRDRSDCKWLINFIK